MKCLIHNTRQERKERNKCSAVQYNMLSSWLIIFICSQHWSVFFSCKHDMKYAVSLALWAIRLLAREFLVYRQVIFFKLLIFFYIYLSIIFGGFKGHFDPRLVACHAAVRRCSQSVCGVYIAMCACMCRHMCMWACARAGWGSGLRGLKSTTFFRCGGTAPHLLFFLTSLVILLFIKGRRPPRSSVALNCARALPSTAYRHVYII